MACVASMSSLVAMPDHEGLDDDDERYPPQFNEDVSVIEEDSDESDD
jgi:hypothetical protein